MDVCDRILTVGDLMKRGLQIISKCALCKTHEEMVEHGFRDCIYSQTLRKFLGDSLGLDFWERPSLMEKIRVQRSFRLSRLGILYGESCFYAVCWVLWLERNQRTFESNIKIVDQVIDDVKGLLWSWGLIRYEGKKVVLDNVMFLLERIIRVKFFIFYSVVYL